jgi:hypothetical protein
MRGHAAVLSAGRLQDLNKRDFQSYGVGEFRKPATLETSRFMRFVKYVFRDKELAKILNLELTKSRSREHAVV